MSEVQVKFAPVYRHSDILGCEVGKFLSNFYSTHSFDEQPTNIIVTRLERSLTLNMMWGSAKDAVRIELRDDNTVGITCSIMGKTEASARGAIQAIDLAYGEFEGRIINTKEEGR